MAEIDYDVGVEVWESLGDIVGEAKDAADLRRAVREALAPLGGDLVRSAGQGEAEAALARAPHTLVYLFHDDGLVYLAAVPDAVISPEMSAALSSANGAHYVVGDPLPDDKWTGVARLMLALGAIEFDELDTIQSDVLGKTLISADEAEGLTECWAPYCEEPLVVDRDWSRVVTLRYGN